MACLKAVLQASCLLLTLILACACGTSDSDEALGNEQPSGQAGTQLSGEQVNDPATTNVPDTGTEAGTQSAETGEAISTPAWTPMVSKGSDMERLLTTLKHQVSNTLLMLNQKINGGEILTQTEAICVGSHASSLGQPLFAIECTGAPLTAVVSSPTVRVSLPRASFFSTDACQASLFDAHSTDCQLSSSQLIISNEWVVPPSPQLPYPIAGMQISYAIESPVLILESLADVLSEPFYCKIDLLTGLPDTESSDCAAAVSRAAERLDQLVLQPTT